jgi:predicted dehydrogenase
MSHSINRRTFIGAAALSPLILPRSVFGAERKLNVAFIGMGGRIQGHVRNVIQQKHNVVAFCDADPNQIARSKKRHKDPVAKAKEYGDYRKLIETEKTLDAVVISTPDHWHAPICTAAIKAGLHVYCEKPLTHTVGEARALAELARKAKVVTQTGNQGSASPNLRRSIELIQAGLFGQISNVHVWHPSHGWPCGMKRPADIDPVPQGMNWDLWCGPSPKRPYKNGIYHPAKWRGWYDFGNGSIGDFCCHSFNMPVRALKLGRPSRVEVSGVTGAGFESYAKTVTHTFRFAADGERAAVNLIYYTGGPNMPPKRVMEEVVGTFGKVPRVGAVLEGERGMLSAGLWNSKCYVKLDGDKKFMGHANHGDAKKIPQTLPRVRDHLQEWTDAILNDGKTFSPFEFGGKLTEIGLSGNIALKLQRNFDWDGEAMKAKGLPQADALVNKRNRTKWL